jgi:transcription antitermination protein NusB
LTLRERRKGREIALQALYQMEITGEESEQALATFAERSEASPQAKSFALVLVRGVLGEREKIDALVAETSRNWRVERLSRIDLNVIRVATYELMALNLPVEIAINEAIEVARRFGSEDSTAFVNGVLDQIATRLGLKQRGDAEPAGSE